MKVPMTREVEKPRESVTTIGVFLICWTRSKVRARVSSEVFSPRMISTRGILSAGEKKWTPMKSLSRSTPVASSVIGRVEVFDPRTASGSTMFWISPNTCCRTRLVALDGMCLARLGGGVRGIPEGDLDAGLRCGVGDCSIHHSGSEDPVLPDLTGLVPVRSGTAGVDVAEVEEERLDHVLRHRSVGEVDEVPGLDRQRGVDIDARTFDGRGEDRARGRHRRALGLTAQHRRQSREHRGELGRGRRSARDLEALDVPGLSRFGVV